ncbi:hypothetical protein [Streptosporangium lutulentum]|uniref:Uncharacterized protein n=1 Tax=Streptosporangium lutulentum TaxID=1461250 RepID=A0ABT9Q6V5_9ACTN|nr:hypothetical protein [Streptosporangium lutulentum]MDP9842468.1 hypothetical protein [Streptosporangium lutulentum]
MPGSLTELSLVATVTHVSSVSELHWWDRDFSIVGGTGGAAVGLIFSTI